MFPDIRDEILAQARRRRKRKTIFTITTLNAEADPNPKPLFKGLGTTSNSRCWGWFNSLKDARKGLRHVIWSGEEYGVIEEFREGSIAQCVKEYWYRAEYKEHNQYDDQEERDQCPACAGPPKLTPIKKPKIISHVVSFGIG